LVVSLAGLGCSDLGSRLDERRSEAVVRAALDVGITFFDTADVYGGGRSERVLGKALAGDRDRVIIATKVGTSPTLGPEAGDSSRRRVVAAVDESLRRLGTDWIDLYQLHFPDNVTPMEETLSALDTLITQGKVRYIGSSNLMGWQVADAEWTARSHGFERFISAQNEWNLLDRRVEREVLPACRKYQIGVLPYHPLANGMLTGKYKRGHVPASDTRLASWPNAENILSPLQFDRVERLTSLAAAHGRTVLELSLGWLAAHPEVCSVITGATSPDQVRANAEAVAWQQDDELVLAAVAAVRGNDPGPIE
jgi:aryl-alcohol dehydrogenase-like predicted oxidoreductase